MKNQCLVPRLQVSRWVDAYTITLSVSQPIDPDISFNVLNAEWSLFLNVDGHIIYVPLQP